MELVNNVNHLLDIIFYNLGNNNPTNTMKIVVLLSIIFTIGALLYTIVGIIISISFLMVNKLLGKKDKKGYTYGRKNFTEGKILLSLSKGVTSELVIDSGITTSFMPCRIYDETTISSIPKNSEVNIIEIRDNIAYVMPKDIKKGNIEEIIIE